MSVDEKKLIKKLHDTGHFWNPSNPNGFNVEPQDLRTLNVKDKVVKEAIGSWQAIDTNFDTLSFILHLRNVIADGDIGPATEIMATTARCPIPDYAPPPTARFLYEDPGLQAAVESYQRYAAAIGSGSWPVPGCDPTRKNVKNEHSVRVGLDTSRTPASIKAYLDQALLMTRKCSAEVGLAVRYVPISEDAEFDVRWENIPGNVIGYCYFPDPGTCNQVVTSRIDTNYDAGAIMLANLLVHEYLGHGIGLKHTRGGIMNPSILKVDPLSWIGDVSESIVRRYFGGQPVPLDDGPGGPVDPPVPPGEENGVFLFDGKLFKIKVWKA